MSEGKGIKCWAQRSESVPDVHDDDVPHPRTSFFFWSTKVKRFSTLFQNQQVTGQNCSDWLKCGARCVGSLRIVTLSCLGRLGLKPRVPSIRHAHACNCAGAMHITESYPTCTGKDQRLKQAGTMEEQARIFTTIGVTARLSTKSVPKHRSISARFTAFQLNPAPQTDKSRWSAFSVVTRCTPNLFFRTRCLVTRTSGNDETAMVGQSPESADERSCTTSDTHRSVVPRVTNTVLPPESRREWKSRARVRTRHMRCRGCHVGTTQVRKCRLRDLCSLPDTLGQSAYLEGLVS